LLCAPCAGDRCQSCNGACLVSEKKTFEVQVEPGMKHGQKIVLRGEAGCTEPGLSPGDVILVMQQKPHEVFKRIQQANPSDLLLEKEISLREALCGYSFSVQHLDGRVLHIKTKAGEVIKPNSFMVVTGEGMPVHGRPFVKGNLYVRFEVGGGEGADCVRARVFVGGAGGHHWVLTQGGSIKGCKLAAHVAEVGMAFLHGG
jgi:DnaJ family protein A protein 2